MFWSRCSKDRLGIDCLKFWNARFRHNSQVSVLQTFYLFAHLRPFRFENIFKLFFLKKTVLEMKKIWNSHWITWQIDKTLKKCKTPIEYHGKLLQKPQICPLRTYGNSPLCPTGHRPFGAAALLSLHFFSYHSKQGIGYRWPCAILGWLVYHCPCPPAHDFGSRESGLVMNLRCGCGPWLGHWRCFGFYDISNLLSLEKKLGIKSLTDNGTYHAMENCPLLTVWSKGETYRYTFLKRNDFFRLSLSRD